jgi:hypothetical protein
MFSKDPDVELRRLAADHEFRHRDAARHAVRFRQSGDAADLIAVHDDPHPCAMVEIVFALAGAERPWLNWVPMPAETIIEVANMAGIRRAKGEQITMGRFMLSAAEPASAMTASFRVAGYVDADIFAFPHPDIRTGVRPGRYAVWRYDGTMPVPAVAAPSVAAIDLVRDVAGEAWHSPLSGYLQAEPLGRLPLDDLLGLLAHLPTPPDTPRWQHMATVTPTYWYRLMQPWVCLGILHHATDESWATSTRRRVLVDLAFGVEDWVADAALFALVTAAYRETDLRAEVRELVRARLDAAVAAAATRVVTIEPSLAQLMLVTPGCRAADRAVATAALARLAAKEGKQPGSSKRRWWQRGR